MLRHDAATDATRETTKWLIGLVPSAAIFGLALSVGPRVLEGVRVFGFQGWIELGGSKALVGVGCVLVGVALVVFKGARVLEAEPPTLDSLLHPAPYERVADELKDAVEIGITQPYWNRPESFLEALAELTAPRAKPDLQAVIDSAEECDPANPESAAELEKVTVRAVDVAGQSHPAR